MIKIYGTVYHSLDYTILDNDSLFDLVFKGNKDLSDISRLDYVDGIFSILYENEDYKIIVSDAYGLYPLFYNIDTLEVTDNFNKNLVVDWNSKYINLEEKFR